jgi:hypothetical protein
VREIPLDIAHKIMLESGGSHLLNIVINKYS